ncbi:hypothetical protein CAEBREN_04767 [Caenorhabditis brenneri]|uniref:RING-type domain-containing protein n=1 Tax=Caenorhabditis brenneri TaxID=135651 RepID=G0NSG3_CAEBE|nr:hypothetical protein CAEBREN_04767 [Caenorhabditis brenneri]
MGELPSLLCPECGKLYDLKETFPECEHLYCASCFFVTNDMTCKVCKAQDVELCELLKDDAIKLCLKTLEMDLKYEDDDFMEKQIRNIQERCSKCSQSSELSMICVNCTRIKMKRLENEEWIIQEVGGDVGVADDVLCAECAVLDHGGHELVDIAEDAIKNEFFLEYYHHRESILIHFAPKIETHKERADLLYKFATERNYDVDFETFSTQLIKCFQEESNKLTDAVFKVLKLIMRLQKMYIDCLQKHIDHQRNLYEKAATNKQKQIIQRLLLRLSMIKIKIEEFIQKYSQIQLTPEDIGEIDAEVNARMETLEMEFKKGLLIEVKLENGSKFHKYQAILKEAKKINDRFELSNESDLMSIENDFIEKCEGRINFIRGNFHGQGDSEEAIKFYQTEILQAKIRQEKDTKKTVENNERWFFMELMKLKFFPVTPEADPMDAVYNRFFRSE